jgi:hypothetical protein
MAIHFKQKCARCKKNYVAATNRSHYIVCWDCQKNELQGEITDPAMKRLFKIPEEMYMNNSFLRDIKSKYLRYGNLSDKQIQAFKKTVKSFNES